MSFVDGRPDTYTIGSSPYPSRKSCITEVMIAGRSLSIFSFNASIPKMPVCVFVCTADSFSLLRIFRTLLSIIPILLLKSSVIVLIYSRRRTGSCTQATREQMEFKQSVITVSSLQPRGRSMRLNAFGKGSVKSFSFLLVRLPFAFANSSGSMPFSRRMQRTFAPAFNSSSQFFNEALTPAGSAS